MAQHTPHAAVSIDALLDFFRAGEKPATQQGLGLEHEKFGYHRQDLRPITYEDGIVGIFEDLQAQAPWKPEVDDGNVIALSQRGKGSVTLEPGAQLELSGSVVTHVSEAAEELCDHLDAVLDISEARDLRWLCMGARPLHPLDDIGWVPKSRYNIMRRYLPTRGGLAHHMMKLTCTVQVNVDYTDEADCADILKTVLRVTPVTSALFAASPFLGGQPSGMESTRCQFWTDTDPDRTGYLPAMLEDGYRYEDYVQYALDVPMFFLKRDGRYHDATSVTFRQFMADGFQGHHATLHDWEAHLSTIFPEVRLKQYIEVRGMDCGPPEIMLASAALWRGIIYDRDARAAAASLTEALDFGARLELHRDMIQRGLQATLPSGVALLDLARELVSIAEAGLRRLDAGTGHADADYLTPLRAQILDRGKTMSRQMLDVWDRAPGPDGLREAIQPYWLTRDDVQALRKS